MKKKLVTSYLLLSIVSFGLLAQTPQAIKQAGDRYFDNEQYQTAIGYYKRTIAADDGMLGAKYQLAECYRLIFDTESAEYYYSEVANSRSDAYPLARFYLGLMKKVNGKYVEATGELDQTIQYMKDRGFNEDPRYRTYYLQAKIEKEGCALALAELTKPNRQFQALPDPVNTEFNDYGAFIYHHDSSIVISSARKQGKGSLIDMKFGESFADLFRFHMTAEYLWSELEDNDRFDNYFNTKLGDGAGAFNTARDKFYYTHCNADQGGCFIYKSDKVDGRWTEPVLLNENINQTGFDSKHPSIAPSGDTLFFASNRTDGLGGYDIWYSMKVTGDNWGPAMNLGDHLNTAFDEISPFYYEKDRALFFASNGHRGFGGFDVFMAKGQTLLKPEIFNVGAPYNSNRDDIFFMLGSAYGYISSNRDGGMGKFDIYSFINEKEKEEEIIAEIQVEEAIAGRNSLFEDDFDFDTPERDKVDQVVSQYLAAKLTKGELVLNADDQAFYNSLSSDDKDRVNRIVNTRYRKMTQSELRTLRVEDEFYYRQLDKAERESVDQIVYQRLQQKDLAPVVSLKEEQRTFYTKLEKSKREKVDQIVSYRMLDAEENLYVSTIYPKLELSTKKQVDAITAMYFTDKVNLERLPLNPNTAYYLKNLESKDEFYAAVKEKVINLSKDKKFELTDDDRIFYQNLSTAQLNSLEELASAFLLADIMTLESRINATDRNVYRMFNNAQKLSADRILAKMIHNLTVSDLYFAEAVLKTHEIARLDEVKDDPAAVEALLQELSESDNRSELMNEVSVERINRFLAVNSTNYLSERVAGFMPREIAPPVAAETAPEPTVSEPSETETASTERVAIETESETAILEREDVAFYQSKEPEIQLGLDRIIAAQYLNDQYANKTLQAQDDMFYRELTRTEKEHIALLVQKIQGKPLSYDLLVQPYTFYNNSAPATKEKWNRLVYGRALEKVNGRYRAKAEDYRAYGNFTDDEKASLDRIKEHRIANDRLISESFVVEALDIPSKPILDNLITYNTSEYNYIWVSGQLTDEKTGLPLANFPLGAQNPGGRLEYQTFTDEQGRFQFENLPSKDYKIVAIDPPKEKFTESYFIRDLDVSGATETTIDNEVTTSLYFNSGSVDLRSEAEVTLREVANLFRSNPDLRIALNGHTDNIGKEQINLELSKSRSESAFQRLVQLGVSPQNIIINFHGMSKPITSNLSRYGRQFNRRVDVKIQGSEKIDYKPATVYLIRPEGTLYSIAQHFDTSVDQLIKLNGLEDHGIRAYEPLRVNNPDDRKPYLRALVELNTWIDAGLQRYTVKEGETLKIIADKFNLPEELIMEINSLPTRQLAAGQEIRIYLTL